MDVNLKFVLGWLIIISITYAVTGYVYAEASKQETLETPTQDQDLSFIDIVAGAVTWFLNLLKMLFSVFFFILPNMPLEVTIVFNLIFQPINAVWLLNIYPFISKLAELVIASGKAVIELIDAIIPF